MIKEKYWAIQIGNASHHAPYLALDSVNQTPQLFLTRQASEEWATQKLPGRTDCYVVKVEIRKIRSEKKKPSNSRLVRRRLPRCPTCNSKKNDGHEYEPDEEQIPWGYPATFKLCAHCGTPLLEVGMTGQCNPFVRTAPTFGVQQQETFYE